MANESWVSEGTDSDSTSEARATRDGLSAEG